MDRGPPVIEAHAFSVPYCERILVVCNHPTLLLVLILAIWGRRQVASNRAVPSRMRHLMTQA